MKLYIMDVFVTMHLSFNIIWKDLSPTLLKKSEVERKEVVLLGREQ